MAVKKGLGRGLGSLFGDDTVAAVDKSNSISPATQEVPPVGNAAAESDAAARMLRIIDVYPNPDQPRKTFDQEPLRSLADSIARHGVMQPIAVREAKDGGYIIIAGERRWRASRIAGLDMIPAVITNADDQVAAELALIENLQRVDLNPVEEGYGYKALCETYGLTESEVGEIIGKSRSAVANAMRLLTLEKPVLDLLRSGELTQGQARPLIVLDPTEQTTLAELTVRDGLSARQVEKLVKKVQASADAPAENDKVENGKSAGVKVDYLKELSEHLSSRMSRKVKLEGGTGSSGRGWMHIEFYSDDDLDYLAGIIVNQDLEAGYGQIDEQK